MILDDISLELRKIRIDFLETAKSREVSNLIFSHGFSGWTIKKTTSAWGSSIGRVTKISQGKIRIYFPGMVCAYFITSNIRIYVHI